MNLIKFMTWYKPNRDWCVGYDVECTVVTLLDDTLLAITERRSQTKN